MPAQQIIVIISALCLIRVPGVAQSMQFTHASYRKPGSGEVHAAAGVSHGIRLGGMYFASHTWAVESSFGYIGLTVSALPPATKSRLDGMALSLGADYFVHGSNDISSFVSAVMTYMRSLDHYYDRHLERLAFSAMFGGDMYVTKNMNAFFRIGPSLHVLLGEQRSDYQLFLNFDGGIGWAL